MNPGPHTCKACALPLSYIPFRTYREKVRFSKQSIGNVIEYIIEIKFLQLPFPQKCILPLSQKYIVKLSTEDTGKVVLHLYHKMAVSPYYILSHTVTSTFYFTRDLISQKKGYI